ncbi:hypothetical protein [Haloferula sp.]|uniref:hypothetical protein n=1 Tax=Haloferula sp. TaxID=2497595 RepID=UPI003C7958C8
MNWYRIFVVGWLLTVVSCGLFGEKEEKNETAPEAATAPKLVGRIASINAPQRFVLIEGYGEWKLGEGLLLSSFGGGNQRSGSLIASGERMGRFAAADWKSGQVEVGDLVYARPLRTDVDPSEAEDFSKIEENGAPHGDNFEKIADGTD